MYTSRNQHYNQGVNLPAHSKTEETNQEQITLEKHLADEFISLLYAVLVFTVTFLVLLNA